MYCVSICSVYKNMNVEGSKVKILLQGLPCLLSAVCSHLQTYYGTVNLSYRSFSNVDFLD